MRTVHSSTLPCGFPENNLIAEALGEAPSHLSLRTRTHLLSCDGCAALLVRDTGPGIASADAERIFQPFVRLDAARAPASAGSGLGLSIARSIVLAHEGTITVESAPGRGSRFVIHLPLAGPP